MYLATARPLFPVVISTLDHHASKAPHVQRRLSDTTAKLIVSHHDLRGNILFYFEKVRTPMFG